MLAGSLSSSI